MDEIRVGHGHQNGTPFTDRGFENVPALQHLEGWLAELRQAA